MLNISGPQMKNWVLTTQVWLLPLDSGKYSADPWNVTPDRSTHLPSRIGESNM